MLTGSTIQPSLSATPLSLRHSVCTDIGRRENQEDRHLIDLDLGLFVVADGMGGHPRGDEAAQVAIDAFHSSLISATYQTNPEARLKYALDVAHWAVQALDAPVWPCPYCRQDKTHKMSCYVADERRPGTTLTVLWFVESKVYLCHVGDSMAYGHHPGFIAKLTKVHKFGWGLSQHLGMDMDLDPQIESLLVQSGDTFILCSDGMVLDDQALRDLCEMCPIEHLSDQAVRESLEHRRGGDNVT